MNIVICDDEELARSRLHDQVSSLPGLEVIAMVENGLEMLELCQKKIVDIVLLDIRMPVMDGLEAARHLSQLENPPAIIFTTAYDQHAIKAFEASASDYLLKPVRQNRLEQALQKAKGLNRAQLASLQKLNREFPARTHICVQERGNLLLIPLAEILYLHADHKYVCVGTADKEYLVEESLKALEYEFQNKFFRVHRATLVSIQHIQSLVKNKAGKSVITLTGTDQGFEVSRRLLPTIRKLLKNRKAG